MIEEYTKELYRFCPSDARIITCQFQGDPHGDLRGKWRPRVLARDGSNVDDGANVYINISACKKNARGEYRRRKENFAGGLMIMLDDIPEGQELPPPTCIVETSPKNYQYHYFLDRCETDERIFTGIIRGLMANEFIEMDRAGSASIMRVCRPPVGVNGKKIYGSKPFKVRAVSTDFSIRYSPTELAEALGTGILMPAALRRQDANPLPYPDRVKAFFDMKKMIRQLGMLKTDEPDMAGWIDIRCPFIDGLFDERGNVIFEGHTGSADNGAAIREPAPENHWYGAFRCHHSHAGRGKEAQQVTWRDLTDYLASEAAEVLEDINRHAGDASEYIGEERG